MITAARERDARTGRGAAGPGPRPTPHLIGGGGYALLMVALGVALVAAVTLAVSIGAVTVPFDEVWRVIGRHLSGGAAPPDASAAVDDRIIWELRLTRALLAAVVGAGLSVAGTVLQAVVRNPLADPYVLGVVSGASLGAVAVLTLGGAAVGGLGVSAAAFVGAMGALVLVLILGQRSGRFVPTRLVLAGVAVGYLLSAVTSYLQLRAEPNELAGVLFWLLGSVAGAHWSDLGIPTAVVVGCTGLLVLHGRRLNALLLGEESAASLGVNVHRFRLELLLVSSLLTGVVIAVAGGVGFVGLMIPHAVRLLVGPDHRRVLPLAVLVGGVFLVLVDVVARTVQRPTELPLGIITAAIGAPFFLWLLQRQQRRRPERLEG